MNIFQKMCAKYTVTLSPLQCSSTSWVRTLVLWYRSTLGKGIILVSMAQADIFQCWMLMFVLLPTTLSHSLCLLYCSLLCCSGSVGSKAQGGQPGSGMYGTSVAPVASQGSSSFSHGSAATTTAPYSTDTSTDYSQYNQAYTQVLQLIQTHLLREANEKNMFVNAWCACLFTIVLSVTRPKMWERQIMAE